MARARAKNTGPKSNVRFGITDNNYPNRTNYLGNCSSSRSTATLDQQRLIAALNEGPVPCSTQQSILQGEQEREIVQREGVRTGGRGEPLSFVPHRSAQLPASSFAAWLNKFAATHCCHGKLVGVTYLLSTFTFESDFLARVTRVEERSKRILNDADSVL